MSKPVTSTVASKQTKTLDRRVIKTRTAIREALKSLVVAKGFKGVSISSIAREANIDRKTFYLHYESIDDLVESLIKEHLTEVSEVITRLPSEANLKEALSIFFTEISAIIMNNIDFYRYLSGNLSIDYVIKHLSEPLLEWILELNPSLSAIDEAILSYLLSFHIAGVVAMYDSWLQSPESDAEGIAEVSSLAAEVVFNSFEGLGFRYLEKRLQIVHT